MHATEERKIGAHITDAHRPRRAFIEPRSRLDAVICSAVVARSAAHDSPFVPLGLWLGVHVPQSLISCQWVVSFSHRQLAYHRHSKVCGA